MDDGAITALDLSDDEYTVVQAPFRNKYRAYDADGDLVLRSKQKLLKLREEFPFFDADGDPAFAVRASGVLDVAGDYTLVDARTDEPVVVLDRQFTLVADRWTVRDAATGDPLADITTRNRLVELLRSLHAVFSLVPHSYDITAPDGRRIGAIEGRLSVRDTYRVRVDAAAGVPREAILAAAMVVDAIEAN